MKPMYFLSSKQSYTIKMKRVAYNITETEIPELGGN
jgi:hypothetical protein